ncbi:MAG: response regulator [Acidobacteriota bacterium]|nr:response regulator [Acidobacteriota bacterium]MDH3784754.1 response regulator [Acidobacteriota bacterium]
MENDMERGGHILVIDDEEPILELLRDILTDGGHTVVTALSGREALVALKDELFDLVFTDVGMPDMTGWDVCRHVHDMRPSLPVVLITGWGSSVTSQETDEAGVAAVIGKPFQVDELLAKTEKILEGRSLRR